MVSTQPLSIESRKRVHCCTVNANKCSAYQRVLGWALEVGHGDGSERRRVYDAHCAPTDPKPKQWEGGAMDAFDARQQLRKTPMTRPMTPTVYRRARDKVVTEGAEIPAASAVVPAMGERTNR